MSISSPFEALAVPVFFFFLIKCEVFCVLFFLFSCVKEINDKNKSIKTFFLQQMHLIIDPVCNDLIIG